MSYIAKTALTERLDPKVLGADKIRALIDGAYAVGEAAHAEREALRDARDPAIGVKLKASVAERYVPRLAELARPLAALRSKVDDERKANRGRLSDIMAALHSNLALADGALWTTRRDLAPMCGLRIADLEVMEILAR